MWDERIYFTLAGLCTIWFIGRFNQLSMAMRMVAVAHSITYAVFIYAKMLILKGEPNNQFVFHYLLLFQYLFYGLAYYFAIDNSIGKKLILWSVPIFIATSLTFSFTIQPLDQYNSYALILYNFLIVIWSLLFLWQMFSEIKIAQPEKEPMFWISVGLFFTSLGNFFTQGLMSHLVNRSREYARKVYVVEEVMVFLLLIMFVAALLADRSASRQKKRLVH